MSFIEKKFIPRRSFIQGGWCHFGSAASGLDDSRADSLEGHGCGAGAAIYGYLASARRRAGLLEPRCKKERISSFLSSPSLWNPSARTLR